MGTYRNLNMTLDHGNATVSFSVENSGHSSGAEVAQLYLGFPSAAGEPPLQLKGFHKTKVLTPGDVEKVTLALSPRDFSTWNTTVHAWSPVAGTFQVRVGSSSRDIRLHAELKYHIRASSPHAFTALV